MENAISLQKYRQTQNYKFALKAISIKSNYYFHDSYIQEFQKSPTKLIIGRISDNIYIQILLVFINLMPLIICGLHNLPNINICFKDQCNNLFCQQCFKVHANEHQHLISVKLNMAARQFFIKWSDFLLVRLRQYQHIIKSAGYSKLFEMKLQLNYPKGTVGQLNHEQIQHQSLQALYEHIQLTTGNLQFIKGVKQQSQMIHPQFLKDLFNLVVEDAKFNIQNLNSKIQQKLIEKFRSKQIYQYAIFHIVPKQILHLQQQRKKIVNEYQAKIVVRIYSYTKSPTKSSQNSPSKWIMPNQPTENKKQGHHYHTIHPINHQPECQKHQHVKQIQNLLLQNQASKGHIQQLQKKILVLESQLMQKSITKTNLTASQESDQKVLTNQKYLQLQERITQLNTINSAHIQKQILTKKQLIDLHNLLQNKNQVEISIKAQIQKLASLLGQKQNSIINLNRLISNQEQEIAYRQNQVDILQGEIKKLLQKIKFLQGSIHSLNNLISNQQEEISYRQNQVQTLTSEINKLLERIKQLERSIQSLNQLISNQEQQISYRQNESQILAKQVKKLVQKNCFLQKSIHQLNNLIGNQEQEIAYRQNQTENLTTQIKKLLNKIDHLQKSIHYLNNLIANQEQDITFREGQTQILTSQVKKLVQKNKLLEDQNKNLRLKIQNSNIQRQQFFTNSQNKIQQSDMDQLLQQVVLLEAQNYGKNRDIQILVQLITQIAGKYHLRAQQWSQKLGKLKTLEIKSDSK